MENASALSLITLLREGSGIVADLLVQIADKSSQIASLRSALADKTRELEEAEEALRDAAEEVGSAGVEFSDPRISYETVQLTAGWRKEFLAFPAVRRALGEKA